MYSFQQNWRRGQNRFCLEVRGVVGRRRGWGAGVEMASTMYAHMNKSRNVENQTKCLP
jgi:hypothetical protein